MKHVEAIAIGGFDGMHKGHQHLFAELGKEGAIVVIESGYANLTPDKERENYSKYPIFYLDLETIRHLDGEEFILFLKERFISLKKIVVGYDFHFGKDRKYSFNDLKILFDGEVKIVEEVRFEGDSIHSHKIRQKLVEGDIEGANNFLGHNYILKGKHIVGQGLGHKELVATVNIETNGFLVPKDGVYVTLTRVDNEEHSYPSITFIGKRETTDGSFAIETHILGTKIVVQEMISISFISYIRENRKFDTLAELKEMIQKDIAVASQKLQMLQL
jgi:riboflavin kinase/FMN adenylyltransferase